MPTPMLKHGETERSVWKTTITIPAGGVCVYQVFLQVFLVLRKPPYCQHRDFGENSWKCGERLYQM